MSRNFKFSMAATLERSRTKVSSARLGLVFLSQQEAL
jgi:hypothetical protein